MPLTVSDSRPGMQPHAKQSGVYTAGPVVQQPTLGDADSRRTTEVMRPQDFNQVAARAAQLVMGETDSTVVRDAHVKQNPLLEGTSCCRSSDAHSPAHSSLESNQEEQQRSVRPFGTRRGSARQRKRRACDTHRVRRHVVHEPYEI